MHSEGQGTKASCLVLQHGLASTHTSKRFQTCQPARWQQKQLLTCCKLLTPTHTLLTICPSLTSGLTLPTSLAPIITCRTHTAGSTARHTQQDTAGFAVDMHGWPLTSSRG